MWAGNGQACSQRLLSLWLGWGRCGVSPLMGVRRQRQCQPGGRLSPAFMGNRDIGLNETQVTRRNRGADAGQSNKLDTP